MQRTTTTERKNNDDSTKAEVTSFDKTELKFEAYGEGDYRLLRYMPDGTCVFEEASSEHTKNKKDLQQYAQIIYSALEKKIEKEKQDEYNKYNNNNKKYNLKNNKVWGKAEEYRLLAENDLKELMILFDMLLGTLNYDKGTKYLLLQKCLYNKDTFENKQDLCIAVTNRKELLKKLQKLCAETRIHIKSINGIIAQKYYLLFIHQLFKHWKFINTKFSEIDYMQIDSNFPYSTKFELEFFFLPSFFWGMSANPIFLSWPPYPSFSPFQTKYAHITFSINNLSEEDIDKLLHQRLTNTPLKKKNISTNSNKNSYFLPEQETEIYESIKKKQSDEIGVESFTESVTMTKQNEQLAKNIEMKKNKKIKKYMTYYPYIKQEDIEMLNLLDNTSNVSIQFEGITSYMINHNYYIQLELIPINKKVSKKAKFSNDQVCKSSDSSSSSSSSSSISSSSSSISSSSSSSSDSGSRSGSGSGSGSDNEKNNIKQKYKYKLPFYPKCIIPKNIIFKQAKKIHKKLTQAQWVLIDKSIYCILAEQVNNLKDKNNEFVINLDRVYNKNKKIKIHCTQISHKSMEFLINDMFILPSTNDISNISDEQSSCLDSIYSNKLTSVDFSFTILYDSVGKINTTTSESTIKKKRTTSTCTVNTDVATNGHFNDDSVSSGSNDSSDSSDSSGSNDSSDSSGSNDSSDSSGSNDSSDSSGSNDSSDSSGSSNSSSDDKNNMNKLGKNRRNDNSIDYELIQIFLNLALSKLRDLFICSWKHYLFEMPYYSADTHPIIYENAFTNNNTNTILTTFFKWFILSMEKYLRVNKSVKTTLVSEKKNK
ncbi:conserved protein, unknown function [Hepatocystis sp. ex Piliocolobus tephrosceles]|nr:conserved protein, unknown function [Hepatocystis sp. ex Piliocolobus tephrosceles]